MKRNRKEVEDLRKRYSTYKKLYKRAKERLAKRGVQMSETMYSINTYKTMYKAAKSDNPESKNINRDLVKIQTYEHQYSRKQLRMLQDYFRKNKKSITQFDILTGKYSIDKIYNDLLGQGLSKEQAVEIISNDIFGSP